MQRKTSKGAATNRVQGRPTLDIPADTAPEQLITTMNDRLRRTYQAAVDVRQQGSSSAAAAGILVSGTPKGTGDINLIPGSNVTITGTQNGGKVDVTVNAATALEVDKGGTLVGTRGKLNLIEGTNVTITAADNSGAGRVDVTIAASGGGGGGSVTLIQEVITAASQASVTFSSIANTYRDLMVVVRGRGDTSATSVQIRVQANADTGSNYDYITENRFGQDSGTAVVSMRLGDLPAATAPASYAGAHRITVYDYRGTTFFKQCDSVDGLLAVQNSSNMFSNHNAGWWRSTAAISSLKVFLSAGNFVNNSVVSLYGWM